MKKPVLKLLRQGGKPKVGDFKVTILIKEEILRLNVSMGNPILMAEVKRRDQLVKVIPRRRFREPTLLLKLREELAAMGQLHNQVDFRLCRHDFVDFKDAGMIIQPPHCGDFPDDELLQGGLKIQAFVDGFHGHFGTVLQTQTLVHFGEAAAAQQFAQLVFVEYDRAAAAAAAAGGSGEYFGGEGVRRGDPLGFHVSGGGGLEVVVVRATTTKGGDTTELGGKCRMLPTLVRLIREICCCSCDGFILGCFVLFLSCFCFFRGSNYLFSTRISILC